MKRMILGIAISLFSLSASANPDLFRCEGKGIKLEMILDWYGKGIQESVKGVYLGKPFAFLPDQNFRHPRKLDPDYQYTFYKDPNSSMMVRMVNPDLASLPDYFYSGSLFVNGLEVKFDCLNPMRN